MAVFILIFSLIIYLTFRFEIFNALYRKNRYSHSHLGLAFRQGSLTPNTNLEDPPCHNLSSSRYFSVTLIVTILFLFSNLEQLSAILNQPNTESKEQILISHVKKSIENAQNNISKLDENVLNLEGMSSPLVRHFLNNICSLHEAVYLEVGSWKGATLVSALYKNEESLADVVTIDNWSLFGGSKAEFLRTVETYVPTAPIRIYEEDCFLIDPSKIIRQPINIYFYDGGHSYAEQRKAFIHYHSVLDSVFIAIVDDWNWREVRSGTFKAFQDLSYEVLYEQQFFTNYNGDTNSWWNGLYIAVVKKTNKQHRNRR